MAIPTYAFFERRGVIDTIADHAHLLSLRLRCIDVVQLILGQAGGTHFGDAELGRNMAGRICMVAREQHGLHACAPDLCDRVRRIRPQGVGQGDQPGECAVRCQPDHGAAFLQIPVRARSSLLADRNVFFLQKRRITRKDGPAVHHACTPRPGSMRKPSDGGASPPPFSRKQRTTALPSGCSERCSAAAAQAYIACPDTSGRKLCTATTRGMP